MARNLQIRDAHQDDVTAITEIYNAEVSASTHNYESRPHAVTQRHEWFSYLQSKNFPVLVAEEEGRVLGFAALTPFHPLDGYRFTVTGSIYICAEVRSQGVGKKLGQALIDAARQREFHTIIAGINAENQASIGFHKSFGFQQVGYFKQIGFKNGQWHDDVCLQLIL